MSGDGFFSSKTFLVSGVAIALTGGALLVYQQYIMCKKERYLESQIVVLSQQVRQLEKDIGQIRENVASSSSTDEIEEVFVDASEVAQQFQDRYNEEIGDDSSYTGENSQIRQSDVDSLEKSLSKADSLMDAGGYENLKEAYEKLSDLSSEFTDNADVYWRLAKSSFLLASEEMILNPNSPHEGQKDLMQKAHDAASTAIKIDDTSGNSHKWMAIITGSVTQFLPVQEQIKSAYVIKTHIQAAIRYNPLDALSHHMLGRWCFSVYMLSWVERKVASTLFAEPPTATLKEAMDCFLKAEELSPKSSIDNALFLAKCYIQEKDYKKAVYWLQAGADMTTSSRDDMKSKAEIQTLLAQYESYADS